MGLPPRPAPTTCAMESWVQAPEPLVPQSHLPHLKTGPLTPGGPPWGCQSQVCVGDRRPLGLSHRQAETGHITRMLKAGAGSGQVLLLLCLWT